MTLARPTLRQEQRGLTRRRIADAARACFYEFGVTETSVEQIARAAGVGRATLYLHFANKEAILLELLAANMRGVRGIFRELCELDRVDAATIREWLQRYVAALRKHSDAMRLFHVGLANDPAARTQVDDHRDAVASLLAGRFPAIDLGDAGIRARTILMLARVDHLASAAVEAEPRFDIDAGLDQVAGEFAALLAQPV